MFAAVVVNDSLPPLLLPESLIHVTVWQWGDIEFKFNFSSFTSVWFLKNKIKKIFAD